MSSTGVEPNVQGIIYKMAETIFDEFQEVCPGKTMTREETKDCGKLLTKALNTYFIDDRE